MFRFLNRVHREYIIILLVFPLTAVIMEFERPLMQRVVGNKMVVWGYYFLWWFHFTCFVILPIVKVFESLLKSGEERDTLCDMGINDFISVVCLFGPFLAVYGIHLRKLKRILLRRILEEQSLATAFKELHDEEDLER